MDPALVAFIIRALIQYGPGVVEWLAKLLKDSGSAEEAIERIRAMKSPEELRDEVDAGMLEEPWKSRRRLMTVERDAAKATHFLIIAQSLFKPGSVTAKQTADAEAALAKAEAACAEALPAIEAGDEAKYQKQTALLGEAVATLVAIKAAVCPFLDKEKKDKKK